MKCKKCNKGSIEHHLFRRGYSDWTDYLECDACKAKFEMFCGDEIEMTTTIKKV